MKIAKGVKGIRKALNDDRSGWHVFSEEDYLGYEDAPIREIISMPGYDGYELIGFTGNGLALRTLNS